MLGTCPGHPAGKWRSWARHLFSESGLELWLHTRRDSPATRASLKLTGRNRRHCPPGNGGRAVSCDELTEGKNAVLAGERTYTQHPQLIIATLQRCLGPSSLQNAFRHPCIQMWSSTYWVLGTGNARLVEDICMQGAHHLAQEDTQAG